MKTYDKFDVHNNEYGRWWQLRTASVNSDVCNSYTGFLKHCYSGNINFNYVEGIIINFEI